MDQRVTVQLTPVDDPSKASLAKLSRESLESYRQLLMVYGPDSDAAPQVPPQRLLSEYGRLKIWTEQTGATLETRGSLEDTLQVDPALREDVAGIFRQLKAQLSTANNLVSKSGGDALADEALNIEQDTGSNFTSDSEYSTASQNPDGAVVPRPRISRVALLLLHVFEQIALLYHYSAIFRRPRLEGRYIHSKSREAIPTIPSYEFSHVQQKLQEWRSRRVATLREATATIDPASEAPIAWEQNIQAASGPSMDFLCMRLAAANARRRSQLRYWDRHPFRPGEHHQSLVDTTQDDAQSLPDVSEGHSRRSNPTVFTFSSVAQSAIFETETQAGPSRTIYADSAVGVDRMQTKIPKIPEESKLAGSFECPYCHMDLDSEQMRNRNTWKRHVFRDLRPYTCTFARCGNPDKLYATRRDWTYHEMQVHRRQWNCRFCSSVFSTEDLMSSHLKAAHAQAWDRNQLRALLAVSEGPADESKAQPCIFCGLAYPVKRLMGHVAGHLEELSMFVLPKDGTSDPVEVESSGILSSLDSARDDISYAGEELDRILPEAEINADIPPGTEPSRFPTPPMAGAMSGQIPPRPINPVKIENTPETHLATDQWPPQAPDPVETSPTVFKCLECSSVFDQIHKLNHHKRYHYRPHECPHSGCNMRFGTKTHLDRHINDKHLIARKYHCSVEDCAYSKGGKSFPRKDNWKRHMQNKHGIIASIDSIPDDLIQDPGPIVS